MNISAVGILSPGDMGHAIGAVLHRHGMKVITNLNGRSERTQALAKDAGISGVADDETLVHEADVLLSIMPPSSAYAFGEHIASILKQMKTELVFVDCNAIAPRTAQALDRVLTEAGAVFVDAGIIGNPPRQDGKGPRIYVSGERAAELAQLPEYGLDIRVIGSQSGQASGLKMCYGSVTKGLTALATQALIASRMIGLQEALISELSALPIFQSLQQTVPSMPPKAYRWIGEMQEEAHAFADLGLPSSQMPEGAAALYHFISETELGHETPEQQRQHSQTLEAITDILATTLEKQTKTEQNQEKN